MGIEPTTFGLEVQRAILCATGTHVLSAPYVSISRKCYGYQSIIAVVITYF